MTTEELNIACETIAKLTGWEPHESWSVNGRIKMSFNWRNKATGERRFKPLNYFEDADTRPEMLAVMTEEQKESLLSMLLGNPNKFNARVFYLSLLELSQPDFAAKWLEVMGK